LTVRSISMIRPEGGGSGGAPAATARLARSRARSLASSRDGRVLIRCPPASTQTRWVSAQILITRPVLAGPSQICCPATCRFAGRRDHPVQLDRATCLLASDCWLSSDRLIRTGRADRFGRTRGNEAGRDAQAEDLAGRRDKPGRGKGHAQRLVRAVGVVLCAPRVDGGLGVLDALERLMHIEQFLLQG